MYGYYESCTLRPYPDCSIPELEAAIPELEQKRLDIEASLGAFLSSIRMLKDGTDPPDEKRLRECHKYAGFYWRMRENNLKNANAAKKGIRERDRRARCKCE